MNDVNADREEKEYLEWLGFTEEKPTDPKELEGYFERMYKAHQAKVRKEMDELNLKGQGLEPGNE